MDFSDDVSLIISIWDEDSDSKDDYMAGIRIKLNEVQYFENRGVVPVELEHQDIDGHVCFLVSFEKVKFEICSLVNRLNISGGEKCLDMLGWSTRKSTMHAE